MYSISLAIYTYLLIKGISFYLMPFRDRPHSEFYRQLRSAGLWGHGFGVIGSTMMIMMSPAAHRRFVVPIHRALGRAFPYTIVHLHSAQLHTVSNLLDTEEIAAIEITPDFGENMVPTLPIMAQILERKPLLVHGVMTVESAKEIMRALRARGLALIFRCDTPAAAARVLDSIL